MCVKISENRWISAYIIHIFHFHLIICNNYLKLHINLLFIFLFFRCREIFEPGGQKRWKRWWRPRNRSLGGLGALLWGPIGKCTPWTSGNSPRTVFPSTVRPSAPTCPALLSKRNNLTLQLKSLIFSTLHISIGISFRFYIYLYSMYSCIYVDYLDIYCISISNLL